jgi:hypothetical protein
MRRRFFFWRHSLKLLDPGRTADQRKPTSLNISWRGVALEAAKRQRVGG